ncbi:MAG: hypothetical protein DHS20C13_03330 [Thermodesulfobacteriota bacterium]|nr:MAG: hypothetical protein DHS20C13_03330 [Thermodesulfobacteriota bacterium]
MKKLLALSVFVLMLVFFSICVYAQEAEMVEVEKGPKGVKIVDVVVMQATVQAINANERIIILADDAGNVQTIEVDPEVKNFDQIALGDIVTVEYFESVALFLGSPGDKPGESVNQIMHTAEKGERPGMVAIDVVEIIATVDAIDKENRKVKLKGPDATVAAVKVDPSIGNLENIKVGDIVHARFTEAVAVSVTEPE